MKRYRNGSAPAKRSRFFGIFDSSPRSGTTLMELLLALILIGVLAGTVGVVKSASNDGQSPEKEAKSLAHWLSNAMTISNRSGRPFTLVCPGNVALSTVALEWQNPLKKETYAAVYGGSFIRYQNSNPTSIYTPQWNTLTPAVTIRVGNGKTKADYFTIVSGHGRVRTDKNPPMKDE